MISCKAVTKILYGNFEKSFLECEKMASRNIFRQIFCANFFTRRSGSCNFSFLKNSLVQINSKLNSKPDDYLYLLRSQIKTRKIDCFSVDKWKFDKTEGHIFVKVLQIEDKFHCQESIIIHGVSAYERENLVSALVDLSAYEKRVYI